MRACVVFIVLIAACGTEIPLNGDSGPAQDTRSNTDSKEDVLRVDSGIFPDFQMDVKPADIYFWDSSTSDYDQDFVAPDQTPAKPDAFVQLDQGLQPDQTPIKPDQFVQLDQGPQPDQFVLPCKHPPVIKNCTNGWCTIPAGCFKMIAQGSGKPPCSNKKWREVRINHSFVISQHETTKGEHYSRTNQCCVGSGWKGGTTPAIYVPVGSAEYYCNNLSAYEGREQCYTCTAGGTTCWGTVCTPIKDPHKCKGYRLPTEAEWEYAYRAGTQTDYYNGDMATCGSKWDTKAYLIAYHNQGGRGTVFAQKKCLLAKNAWGLCDMSGNVQEWMYDNYVPPQGTSTVVNPVGPTNLRGVRGGYYKDYAWEVMGASRLVIDPKAYASAQCGYRCVRTL